MRTLPPVPRAPARPEVSSEAGVALVLTLIFSILLYILVAELVVSGSTIRATGENDALLARMRNQMVYELDQCCDQLAQDLAGAASGGSGSGGLGNLLGGSNGGSSGAPGGAAGGEGGEEEADPAASCDSSRDSWFQPVGKPDNDLTTYVWVEDENRKFNILSLWSPEEKFAEVSRERLIRLIDSLRQDTEFDISTIDAERIANDLKDWVTRPDTDSIPRPLLKSDDPKRSDLTIPMHLDEMLMLPSVTEDVFYDKVVDGIVYLGLESVLTIWTSLTPDPGDPEKVARQKAEQQANGETSGNQTPGTPGGNANGNGSGPGNGSGQNPGGAQAPATQPIGEGIKINVNTASRAVLRAIAPPEKISDRVIDAIIKYRNQPDEKELEKEGQKTPKTDVTDFGSLQLGTDTKLKIFATVSDLEQVEEFRDLPDPQVKADFQKALTTKSDVFSIHLASLFKRNEENHVYVLRRARSIVQRYDDGSGTGKIRKLVAWEDRSGLRVMPVDLQEKTLDLTSVYSQMDQFAQEDRIWNPFFVDFYLPKDRRQQFYQPR